MSGKIYCVICGKDRPNRKHETIEHWKTKLDPALLLPPIKFAPSRSAVCQLCADRLRNPYLIYDPKLKSDLRAIRTTSRKIRITKGKRAMRINGLLALDPIEKGLAFPYPGLLVDEAQLSHVEKELNVRFTREYAKGGPNRGIGTILFGHLAPRDPYHCGHFVNCVHKTDLKPNAKWGEMYVDADFLKRYPHLEAREGERFPAIRIIEPIAPGDEILLKTYGASYWIHHEKEANADNVIKMRTLAPPIKRLFEETNDKATKQKRQKRE